MVYKGRMFVSFIPLHARMTSRIHVVFFMGPRTILTQMINLEDLFGRFETLRTKLTPKRNFRDPVYSPNFLHEKMVAIVLYNNG
jgi:hypothetical protein